MGHKLPGSLPAAEVKGKLKSCLSEVSMLLKALALFPGPLSLVLCLLPGLASLTSRKGGEELED